MAATVAQDTAADKATTRKHAAPKAPGTPWWLWLAVFSIVGQQANSKAGGIVGYQRINNAKTPVEFSVPYDTTAIDQKQSYAIFGSIIDGSTVYQTFEPVPVITGGPTTGVTLVATDKPPPTRAR
jgi:hypothetical protein